MAAARCRRTQSRAARTWHAIPDAEIIADDADYGCGEKGRATRGWLGRHHIIIIIIIIYSGMQLLEENEAFSQAVLEFQRQGKVAEACEYTILLHATAIP